MFLTRTNKGKTGVLVLLSASLVVFSLGSLSAYPTAAQATCKSGRVKTVHQSSRVSRLAKLRKWKVFCRKARDHRIRHQDIETLGLCSCILGRRSSGLRTS